MNNLLLYLSHNNIIKPPLAERFPRTFPWTQMVNRVYPGIDLDPFKCVLKCETIDEIANMASSNVSFEELAMKTARDILNKNQKIYVMWSGGIDSTISLIALEQMATKDEQKLIHLVMSNQSILEFPQLWNIICKKYKGKIYSSYQHLETYCKDGIVITGEHGDQIFGSDIIYKIDSMYGSEVLMNDDYDPIMFGVYLNLFGDDLQAMAMIDRYKPTLQKCPFPIKTPFDWVWWFNFTNKWQHVKYRVLGFKTWSNPKKYFPNIIHFFDTKDWQRWSLDNHDKKIMSTLESYKWPAKDMIVKYTEFDEYINKPKVGSQVNIWKRSFVNSGIDIDFNYMTEENTWEFINK